MSISKVGLVTVAATLFATASAQESPNLGVTPSPELIAAWDISVAADGTGLPPGSGTANDGTSVYTRNCLACHGQEGEGLLHDRLVGGHGTIGGPAPTKTVGSYWPYATTIFDYIRRAMPYLQPQTLSDDETYALTAYLLYLNGIIDADQVMNAATLPEVEMPNLKNFVLAYPEA
ncbi:MAG: cytochrome c [Gammaproteobacteria bacterium]|nr:cytochrome c [Gammaproteobacteria bacterium]